jgi:hypothetical protein
MFWELDVNVESVMSYVYHFIDFGQYFNFNLFYLFLQVFFS